MELQLNDQAYNEIVDKLNYLLYNYELLKKSYNKVVDGSEADQGLRQKKEKNIPTVKQLDRPCET